jgi:hypothetical protein
MFNFLKPNVTLVKQIEKHKKTIATLSDILDEKDDLILKYYVEIQCANKQILELQEELKYYKSNLYENGGLQ